MRVRGGQLARLLVAMCSTWLLVYAVMPPDVYAAQITSRSLTLEAGTDGGSKAGGVVKHLFTFTLPTNQTLGSIQFLYCTTASGTCTMPTGLVTTAATLSAQNGATSFTINHTTNGSPYLTRTAASTGSANLAVSYELSSVTNPTTANQTFYVRISTFASIDTTGASTDTGTVAAATANQIILTGTMPESLIFCTGASITINGSNVPDCTTATSGTISFNQLFSTTSSSWATSQMAASTNASTGYAITVNGPTLTSGGNTIPAIGSTATASNVGTGQFGLNLVTDTTPAVTYFDANNGSVYPASDGVNLDARPATLFATANSYAFTANSNNTVAASDFGSPGTGHPSDAQRFTTTYIANVAGHQAAGSYTTTLTYICTPTF